MTASMDRVSSRKKAIHDLPGPLELGVGAPVDGRVPGSPFYHHVGGDARTVDGALMRRQVPGRGDLQARGPHLRPPYGPGIVQAPDLLHRALAEGGGAHQGAGAVVLD